MDDLIQGRVSDVDALARRDGLSPRAVRLMLNLASLSPRLIEASLDGDWPAEISTTDLARDLPILWRDQHHLVGVS
jgi:hypothetical protein